MAAAATKRIESSAKAGQERSTVVPVSGIQAAGSDRTAGTQTLAVGIPATGWHSRNWPLRGLCSCGGKLAKMTSQPRGKTIYCTACGELKSSANELGDMKAEISGKGEKS